MVENQRPMGSLLRRVAIRIGEGLVIGIGAAMALAGYNAVVDATDELAAARAELEKQQKINDQLNEIAGQSRDTDQELSTALKTVEEAVRGVVKRVEQIEATMPDDERARVPESTEWEALKERAQAVPESGPERREGETQLRYGRGTFEDLDSLIREQKAIRKR